MKGPKLGLLALLAVLALAAAACGTGDSGGTATEEGEEATEAEATGGEEATEAEATGGEEATEAERHRRGKKRPTEAAAGGGGTFSTYICEPESLIPYNTNETCGAEVLNGLYSPLVDYEQGTNEAIWGDDCPRCVAADIASEDNINWTITINEGWTFHDGEPVTAQSFVDALELRARTDQRARQRLLLRTGMADVVGYADMQADGPRRRGPAGRTPARRTRCPASRSSTTRPSRSARPPRSRSSR